MLPIFLCTSDLTDRCAAPECQSQRERESLFCTAHQSVFTNKPLGPAKVPRSAADRDAYFRAIWQHAYDLALATGATVQPKPMVVMELDPLTGTSVQAWRCDEGACGFAWIVVKPATCPFVHWVKKHRNPRTHHTEYGGGHCVYWVSEFEQSIERKYAFAKVFSEVLRANGIAAFPRERLD